MDYAEAGRINSDLAISIFTRGNGESCRIKRETMKKSL